MISIIDFKSSQKTINSTLYDGLKREKEKYLTSYFT